MLETIFEVNDDAEGGFTARACNESMFTEAENLEELKSNIREVVECHFDNGIHYIRVYHKKKEISAFTITL